jgi:hypothetical protein
MSIFILGAIAGFIACAAMIIGLLMWVFRHGVYDR